ncbi:hypothetical protein COLO4_17650 [Corchorus olitorius]|uniref:Cullin N-terminal domain-containing protein n=1 Tax=Corchorus olitorius TaxID=93759 RepID=A0A1R3JBX7_9ROSI|nr:hypothetical protein COLO4_17650 [Corchorus olitorius]
MDRKTISFEQGWKYMEKGITKLKRIMEGRPEPPFTTEECMSLYTTVYNMCAQKAPYDYSLQLYDKYREVIENYIDATVLPSIVDKYDNESMLRELVHRWANHKFMIKWLSRFFSYLEQIFIARNKLPSLFEVGMTCFRNLVYKVVHEKVTKAVILFINEEREGKQIDRALVKDVLEIFIEMGMDCYEKDFEAEFIKDSGDYYSRKALSWINEEDSSCSDYMIKVEECLNKEKERMTYYLKNSRTETKLIEKVQHELLVVHSNQILEKENYGFRALLRDDDKVDHLSRIFRLYCEIPQGLDSVSNMFKEHITAEGMALIQQAEDAAAASKEALMKKIKELHDKYMEYVVGSFQNHTLFHKALTEAFEVLNLQQNFSSTMKIF